MIKPGTKAQKQNLPKQWRKGGAMKVHTFIFISCYTKKIYGCIIWNILFSPETLFSKLRIYFNICLLGNCHLLYRHRVSDAQSSSSRWLWVQWYVGGISLFLDLHWLGELSTFFWISHLHTFLLLSSKAYKSSEKHEPSNQSKLKLGFWIFLCEFWTSDLGDVDNLAWVMWSTLHPLLFLLNNAGKQLDSCFHILCRILPVFDRSTIVAICQEFALYRKVYKRMV